jgi:hypothetical protein
MILCLMVIALIISMKKHVQKHEIWLPEHQIQVQARVPEVICSLFRANPKPCSLGLSATSQQYFSLRTNQPPATSQQYSSLRTNQHQPSATSQPNSRQLGIAACRGCSAGVRRIGLGTRRGVFAPTGYYRAAATDVPPANASLQPTSRRHATYYLPVAVCARGPTSTVTPRAIGGADAPADASPGSSAPVGSLTPVPQQAMQEAPAAPEHPRTRLQDGIRKPKVYTDGHVRYGL